MEGIKFIAYYRVSTSKQGRSGLGLEAQRSDVQAYVQRVGGQLLSEYQDVESGKVDDRPNLAQALLHCQMAGAKLLIAKLDRLSRDVAFIAQLQKSGVVSFVAADMPEAGELQTQLMAVFAQHERKAISERTKAALASAKAKGVSLGRPENLSNQAEGSKRGNEIKVAMADDYAAKTMHWINAAEHQGITSLRAVADYLNQQGLRAPRGGRWSAAQVSRVITRTRGSITR